MVYKDSAQKVTETCTKTNTFRQYTLAIILSSAKLHFKCIFKQFLYMK